VSSSVSSSGTGNGNPVMGSTNTLSSGNGIGMGLTASTNGTFMGATKCPSSSNFLRTTATA
jgi:hypothetical protein